jgi:hypothetical protein
VTVVRGDFMIVGLFCDGAQTLLKGGLRLWVVMMTVLAV